MTKEFQISLYLDTRRAKKDGTYPVKIQLYTPMPKRQKYYSTVFSFTKEDFERFYLNSYKRIPHEVKEIKLKLNAVIAKAEEAANSLDHFSIEAFEKRLYFKKSAFQNVQHHYNEVIKEYEKQERLGTAASYKYSLNSFRLFQEKQSKKIEKLTFSDITPEWLSSFESFMLKEGKSINTVGIYLRPLKAIFNRAISEKDIKEHLYPFGKNKYQIPSSKNNKRALSNEQLKALYNAEPVTPQQEKAKDFWFFSFSSNGMNVKDIALLKYKDFTQTYFEFQRAKTKFTSKTKLEKIKVYLNEFNRSIIEKHGNDKSPESFVFDILSPEDNAKGQMVKIKNFTRFINQNIKKLCIANELPEISSYWARHSFATQGIRKGASMEFMKESLGHKDMKTTEIYFQGFDDETKQEFASKLMDFA